MGQDERTTLELRLVLAVYQAELRHGEGQENLKRVRERGIQLLDALEPDRLNTPQLRALYDAVRAELTAQRQAIPIETWTPGPVTDA